MDEPLAFRCPMIWEAMPEAPGGRYCAGCDKVVIDLDALGRLRSRLMLATHTGETPCVKYTRHRTVGRRAAALGALVAVFGGASVSQAAEPAPQADVHVCSPSGSQVVTLGGWGGRSRFSVLDVLPWRARNWLRKRFSKPDGNGHAHVATTVDWRKVTVRCDTGRAPRELTLTDGEAQVSSLPSHDTCTVRFHGHRGQRDQEVEFRVGDTASEVFTADEAGFRPEVSWHRDAKRRYLPAIRAVETSAATGFEGPEEPSVCEPIGPG